MPPVEDTLPLQRPADGYSSSGSVVWKTRPLC